MRNAFLSGIQCLLLVCSGLSVADEAPERIEVSGLLGEKAVLTLDGTRHVVAVGDVTPEGVELIAIEAEGARLKVDGEERYFPLGSTSVGTRYTRQERVREQVYRNSGGMFSTAGSINGIPVNFLVDTGATTVAMGLQHAKRLGIDYESGTPVSVQTASGPATAWRIKLDEVGVGRIKLRNIDAVVIRKNDSPHILLGMSFLNRLDVQHKGSVMVLEMQY